MPEPKLAWGGYKNGQIPRSALVDVGGGKLLQADAARNWKAFCDAFRAAWGAPLYLADYQDAYRDLARQREMYVKWKQTGLPKNGVAAPGGSIHGWARSVDCSGYGAGGSQRHMWMQRNAARFGFSWAYGRDLNESWHWDYVGAITTTAGGDVVPIPIQQGDIEMRNMRHPSGAVAAVGEITYLPLNGNQWTVESKLWGDFVQMNSPEEFQQALLNVIDRRNQFYGGIPAAGALDVAALVAAVDASDDDEHAAILAAISHITTTATDPAAIAAEVQAILADDFQSLESNIDDQPTEFVVQPKG